MPLHFQSITENDQSPEYLTWLLTKGMDSCESVFASPDKYIHCRKRINDEITGEGIGNVVYTLKVDDEKQAVLVLDLDIMLDSPEISRIKFYDLLGGSSDSNEYYHAEAVEEGGHFELETVNRHTVAGDLSDSERDVHICAFPFELTVFADMDLLNKYVGFTKVIDVADTGIKAGGLSPRFIMPGQAFKENKKEDEHYSFVVGTVRSYSDVRWAFGDYELDFVIAHVDTALGCIPVAMGRDVFDLSALDVGSIIGMNADVKVDLSSSDDFTIVSTDTE